MQLFILEKMTIHTIFIEKRVQKKKEKRKLNPSRFREQSRNRYFLDGRIGTSPHPRRTARPCPTAITPHQIYSPQTSSLVSFSRVSSSLLLSLLRYRSLSKREERNMFGTIVVESWTRTLGTASRVTLGPMMKLEVESQRRRIFERNFSKKKETNVSNYCFVTEFFTTLKVDTRDVINIRPSGYYKSDSVLCFLFFLSISISVFDEIQYKII